MMDSILQPDTPDSAQAVVARLLGSFDDASQTVACENTGPDSEAHRQSATMAQEAFYWRNKSWAQEKAIRAQEELKRREPTFVPELNQRTLEILEAKLARTEQRPRVRKPVKPPSEKFQFKPTLPESSQRLAEGQRARMQSQHGDIGLHERLYLQGLADKTQRTLLKTIHQANARRHEAETMSSKGDFASAPSTAEAGLRLRPGRPGDSTTLFTRCQMQREAREAMLSEQRALKQQRELAECSFRPQTNVSRLRARSVSRLSSTSSGVTSTFARTAIPSGDTWYHAPGEADCASGTLRTPRGAETHSLPQQLSPSPYSNPYADLHIAAPLPAPPVPLDAVKESIMAPTRASTARWHAQTDATLASRSSTPRSQSQRSRPRSRPVSAGSYAAVFEDQTAMRTDLQCFRQRFVPIRLANESARRNSLQSQSGIASGSASEAEQQSSDPGRGSGSGRPDPGGGSGSVGSRSGLAHVPFMT